MDTRQARLQAETRILDSRIDGLDLDERDAVRRRDWSAARNVVLVKAPLKEVRQRTGAPRQR
jgi:hypothetical protein